MRQTEMMKKNKPLANISLDLDNQWSYMKVHGDEGWDQYPSYLEIVVPFVLDLLDELGLSITFFIVGKDAAIEKNKEILKSIVDRGHEIGNNSFNHESWLKTYSKEKIETEIIQAEEAIFQATGKITTCFRGPGFSWSNDLLEVLQKRNYRFDASLLPTYISPLMRAYYFWNSKLTKEERESRKELFGSFKEGFYSIKPFFWKLRNSQKIMEIPVTTIPLFKIPFHLSYILYISSYSTLLMKLYLSSAIFMFKITNSQPSYLLHPLDLISGDKIPQLAFFPGMNIPTNKKIDVFKYVLLKLKQNFEILPMLSFADEYTKNNDYLKNVNLPN